MKQRAEQVKNSGQSAVPDPIRADKSCSCPFPNVCPSEWSIQTDRIRPDEDRTDTLRSPEGGASFVPVREWDLLLFITDRRNQLPFVLSLIRSLFKDGRNAQLEVDPLIALHVRHFVADRNSTRPTKLCVVLELIGWLQRSSITLLVSAIRSG